jgi:DNA-binding Lrp family transcriptional regulator
VAEEEALRLLLPVPQPARKPGDHKDGGDRELARQHRREVGECHRITGEDCFYVKLHLRTVEELGELLDRFLVYGETTASLVNASPVPRRDPPLPAE